MKTPPDPSWLASWWVGFYRFWHGKLHLPGAGRLLKKLGHLVPSLQSYPLAVSRQKFIRVDFRDVSAFAWANFLLGEGFQENALLAAMTKRRKAGGVFWDVGANAGLVSYVMAREARPSRIEFFEPQPALFRTTTEALAGTVAAQGHLMALSDQCREAHFLVMRGESTKSKIGKTAFGSSGLKVKVTTGDSLVFGGSALPPDLIKIDTEGHEREVLAGLGETIRRHQPDIFFEHIGLQDDEIKAMRPAGYKLFTVREPSGELIEGIHRDLGANSAFLIENLDP